MLTIDRPPTVTPPGAATPPERSAELLTAQEVANRLKVGKSTVYVLCRTQGLPYLTIGRLWRCPSDRLEEWIDSRINCGAPT